MPWSAWRLSARLAWSSWVYRILTVWTLLSLIVGIGWYLMQLAGIDTSLPTYVFHYTIYFGTDDVRSIAWLAFWPVIWSVTSLAGLVCAYGTYRRDLHAGIAWLVLIALSALPWMLVLHYLALINR